MSTQCYAMVRGSVVRATALTSRGQPDDTPTYVASRSLTSVEINEITDGGGNEVLRTEQNVPRFLLVESTKTIRYMTDIKFLRVDPGFISLLTGVPLVTNYAGDIVGFDANTRLPVKSFGLEVWTKLGAQACVGGTQQWGYTLFPFLRGGYLSGLTFSNGLASFSVKGAQTRRNSKWGVGPHDLYGPFQRLMRPVSRNTSWRNLIVSATPPVQTNGTVSFDDIIYGGSPSSTTSDVIDGGTVSFTTDWIIDGGAP